jgi:hypothetical protein
VQDFQATGFPGVSFPPQACCTWLVIGIAVASLQVNPERLDFTSLEGNGLIFPFCAFSQD